MDITHKKPFQSETYIQQIRFPGWNGGELNYTVCKNSFNYIKGLVHQKIKIMSLMTHPHVDPSQ